MVQVQALHASGGTEIPVELENAEGAERAEILSQLVQSLRRSDPELALSYAREAVQIRAGLPDSLAYADALNDFGMAHFSMGNLDSTEFFYLISLGIRQRQGVIEDVAVSYNNLGIVYRNMGDLRKAISYYRRSLAIKEECQDSVGMGKTLNNIGLAYQGLGRPELALQNAIEALRIKEALGDSLGLIPTLNNIGLIFMELGDFEQAKAYLFQTLALSQSQGNPKRDAGIYNNIGLVYLDMDSLTQAEEFFNKSLAIRRAEEDKRGLAFTLLSLGNLSKERGDPAQALRHYGEGKDIMKGMGPGELLSEICFEAAHAQLLAGQPRAAIAELRSSGMDLDRGNGSPLLLKSLDLMAEAYASIGRFDSAFKYQAIHSEQLQAVSEDISKGIVTDIHLDYISQEQEAEIAALRKRAEFEGLEAKQAREVQYILFGAILLIVLILIALLQQSARRRRLNRDLKVRNVEVSRKNEELKRLNAELETERLRAEQVSESKSSFLANMSHEIRTPLNGIMGLTSILLDSDLDDEQRRFSKTIYSSSSNLLRILTDILDFSKVETGALEMRKEPFQVDALFQEIAGLLEPLADAKDLSIVFEASESVKGWRSGDSERIRQVLVNLINNAIKFTDKGGVKVRCLPSALHSGYLRFEVEDTGGGIEAKELPVIFDAFKQVDGSISRSAGGVGLGLAICKSLVELMGGEISVESDPGIGSVFHFHLPLAVVEAPAVPVQSPRNASGKQFDSSLSERNPLEILIADDNEVNQMVLERMLQSWGYVPDLAGDGFEVLEAMQHKNYDVVLMDIQMPGMDGLEATEKIRQLYGEERPAIIAVTANAIAGQAEKYLEAGMDGYLSKPFKVEELEALLLEHGHSASE